MYAIAHIIYGIPLNGTRHSVTISEVLENMIDDGEPEGFITHYRGGGDQHPQAFGVEVFEFDECNHHIDLVNMKFTATNEQHWKFQDLFNALPVEIRNEIREKFGEPRMFLLWSSS